MCHVMAAVVVSLELVINCEQLVIGNTLSYGFENKLVLQQASLVKNIRTYKKIKPDCLKQFSFILTSMKYAGSMNRW